MTKHHFEAVAAILRGQMDEINDEQSGRTQLDMVSAVADTALALADYFRRENPRFDTHHFLTACGIDGPR